MKNINTANKKELTIEQCEEIIKILKDRFEKNMNRHKDLVWDKIQVKLKANPGKLWSLNEMEKTGGEPDVIAYDENTDEYIFFDCSPRLITHSSIGLPDKFFITFPGKRLDPIRA